MSIKPKVFCDPSLSGPLFERNLDSLHTDCCDFCEDHCTVHCTSGFATGVGLVMMVAPAPGPS